MFLRFHLPLPTGIEQVFAWPIAIARSGKHWTLPCDCSFHAAA